MSTTPLRSLLDRFDDLPPARRLRSATYQLLGAEPGSRVLDAGCGTGRAVAELTALGVRAEGVDLDPEALTAARARHPGLVLHRGSATELPFADASFDGYRADKLYHALAAPEQAAAEAHRVLVPGGRAVLVGQDWDALILDSDAPELTRRLVHARADRVPSPRAARRYRTLLLDAGFTDVTVEVRTAVLTGPEALPLITALAAGATDEDAPAWLADQHRRATEDRVFLAVPMFLAAGTRPPRSPLPLESRAKSSHIQQDL
ncbi:methyltransferase domain-containing protein [Streptomyces sp. NPDC015232]|uniref:methyltransferase domain-containing protein n=1 Tax=unclassified Streptomyces TaxID=2593676 RepID=UPI0036FD7B72